MYASPPVVTSSAEARTHARATFQHRVSLPLSWTLFPSRQAAILKKHPSVEVEHLAVDFGDFNAGLQAAVKKALEGECNLQARRKRSTRTTTTSSTTTTTTSRPVATDAGFGLTVSSLFPNSSSPGKAVAVLVNNVGMSYPYCQYFHELTQADVDAMVSETTTSYTGSGTASYFAHRSPGLREADLKEKGRETARLVVVVGKGKVLLMRTPKLGDSLGGHGLRNGRGVRCCGGSPTPPRPACPLPMSPTISLSFRLRHSTATATATTRPQRHTASTSTSIASILMLCPSLFC